ncbi:hypothetical protein KK062_22515 [Fulvivirgaceae bacterium PWU5]|uniref:Uncharacterized protein n=1 Tax=Dawidia cretensis TaxID=2782350 RepID=A0AAP2E3S1_9BACT|nr:hypothetical protein [Dawidia cretensis]
MVQIFSVQSDLKRALIDAEKWGEFMKWYDRSAAVMTNQQFRTKLLSNFGRTYAVDDFIRFYNEQKNPDSFERGSMLYIRNGNVVKGPEVLWVQSREFVLSLKPIPIGPGGCISTIGMVLRRGLVLKQT